LAIRPDLVDANDATVVEDLQPYRGDAGILQGPLLRYEIARHVVRTDERVLDEGLHPRMQSDESLLVKAAKDVLFVAAESVGGDCRFASLEAHAIELAADDAQQRRLDLEIRDRKLLLGGDGRRIILDSGDEANDPPR